MNTSHKIGFIGLGEMGLPMAEHLVKKNFHVTGYDINPERVKLATAAGISMQESIAQVCVKSDLVVFCLPSPSISQQAMVEVLQNKGKVQAIIETSTLQPEDVVGFAEKTRENGVEFLSASMFGGQSSAVAGQLWFIVEGEQATFEKYQDFFTMVGRRASYLGLPPQATVAKLARNICRFANVAAAIEVTAFLRKYSNDITPIYELLAEESLTNFDHVWDKTLRKYILENEEYFTSPISVKDLKMVLEMAEKAGVEMPIAKVTKELHERMRKPTV